MNDDIALMPPPPPRRLKRHKTLPSLKIERTALVAQQQEQEQEQSAPRHRDSAMVSLATLLSQSTDGADIDGPLMLVKKDKREMKAEVCNGEGNLGYSLTDGVRPGAVSPEDCASVSMEFGASASIHCVKPCGPEATHHSILTIGSSIHSKIPNKGNSYKSYEDCLADNRTPGNDEIISSNNQQS